MRKRSRFNAAQLKIKRAECHLAELGREIEAFHQAHPYELLIVEDHSHQAFMLAFQPRDVPAWISPIIGDAIHNLRSALECLVNDLVIAGGGCPTRNTGFPITRDTARFMDHVRNVAKGASAAAIKELQEFQSHATRDGILWRLNELDVLDKHRSILTVATVQSVQHLSGTYRGSQISLQNLEASTETGIVSVRLPVNGQISSSDLKLNNDLRATTRVAFGKGQPFENGVVVPVLLEIKSVVSTVIQRFQKLDAEGKL